MTAGSEPAVVSDGDSNDVRLLDHFMGDAELLCDVAQVFLETESELRTRIVGALARNDGMEVSRAAHMLKGSVGNFGAEKAMALAAELELMGRSTELSGAGPVFQALVETLDDLRAKLNGTVEAHRLAGSA